MIFLLERDCSIQDGNLCPFWRNSPEIIHPDNTEDDDDNQPHCDFFDTVMRSVNNDDYTRSILCNNIFGEGFLVTPLALADIDRGLEFARKERDK